MQELKNLELQHRELLKELEIAITQYKNMNMDIEGKSQILAQQFNDLAEKNKILVEKEKKINCYLEYDELEEAMKNLTKVYEDFQKEIDVEKMNLEQEKVDFEKHLLKERERIQFENQKLKEKDDALNKKLEEFNEWKKKFGKLEEFIPF